MNINKIMWYIMFMLLIIFFIFTLIYTKHTDVKQCKQINKLQSEIEDVWDSIYALDEQYIVLYYDVYKEDNND